MSMTPHTPLIEALKERWQNIARQLAPGEPTSAALMRDALIEILRLNEALRIATETTEPDAAPSAGAKPSTIQTIPDREDAGRTGGSIPPTGANSQSPKAIRAEALEHLEKVSSKHWTRWNDFDCEKIATAIRSLGDRG